MSKSSDLLLTIRRLVDESGTQPGMYIIGGHQVCVTEDSIELVEA